MKDHGNFDSNILVRERSRVQWLCEQRAYSMSHPQAVIFDRQRFMEMWIIDPGKIFLDLRKIMADQTWGFWAFQLPQMILDRFQEWDKEVSVR